MEHAEDVVDGIPYVKEAVIFLLATVAIVPLFHHLRASPVLGYLFVGALIGPFGLQIVAHAEGVHVIAELGVVFLLFAIGLELSLTRLRAMHRMFFGLGGLQVLVSAVVIGSMAYLWGMSGHAAIVIGVALALSSTAVVVQLLVERGAFALPVGRTSFAILLLQDLAVVPLLALIGAFGGATSERHLSRARRGQHQDRLCNFVDITDWRLDDAGFVSVHCKDAQPRASHGVSVAGDTRSGLADAGGGFIDGTGGVFNRIAAGGERVPAPGRIGYFFLPRIVFGDVLHLDRHES